MSKPVPLFRTTNWSGYSRFLKRRGSLMVWFDPEMTWFAASSGKAGHPERFSAGAIQFCLSIKVLFGLPLRQTTGVVESLLPLSGLDWPVPDYTTLCRRQKHLKVQIPYRAASGPLHLLVDSTGIRFSGEGEWQVRKHGASPAYNDLIERPDARTHVTLYAADKDDDLSDPAVWRKGLWTLWLLAP